MDPTNPNLFFNLGVVNYNQKKIKLLKEYYKKAIELDPEYRDAYLNLSLFYLKRKRLPIIEEMNANLMTFRSTMN